MGDRTRGLYGKFNVSRTDGTSAPGGKHHGCQYFVLDLDHDPHAYAALRAYAESCRAEYPRLAADLRDRLLLCAFGRERRQSPGRGLADDQTVLPQWGPLPVGAQEGGTHG